MKLTIDIHIDDRLIKLPGRLARHRLARLGAILAVVVVPVSLYAHQLKSQVTVPHRFEAGQVISAADVNANFDTLASAIVNATTACSNQEYLAADGNCYSAPADTNAATLCEQGQYLDGDGTCQEVPLGSLACAPNSPVVHDGTDWACASTVQAATFRSTTGTITVPYDASTPTVESFTVTRGSAYLMTATWRGRNSEGTRAWWILTPNVLTVGPPKIIDVGHTEADFYDNSEKLTLVATQNNAFELRALNQTQSTLGPSSVTWTMTRFGF